MNKFSILLFSVLLATLSCSQTAPNVKQGAAPPNANKPANSSKGEKTSLDYQREGEDLFNAYNFEGAIAPYRQALDLEKKERKLERERWITLVKDLATVYGLTDDLNRSREVLDYGIEQEPTYPMFYYLKACSYGLKNDETNALKNLRLAYQFKDNKLKGEALPDPATDNSFKRLMERKNFEKAVAEMKSAK
jgi:predicted Zn-dependent protease